MAGTHAFADHLVRSASGIWYLRLVIPDHVRAANPSLPKELRRSTKQVQKRAALTTAREMCLKFLTSVKPSQAPMLVSEISSAQCFTIHFENGRVTTEASPGATPETLILLSRITSHVYTQMLARCVRTPETSADIAASTPVVSAQPVVHPTTMQPTVAPDELPPALHVDTPNPSHPVWLSEAIDRWRLHGGVKFSDTTWKHAYSPTFRIFRELIADERRDITHEDGSMTASCLDIRICNITRAHVEKFYTLLQRMPARQGKRKDGVEAPTLIKNCAAEGGAVQTPVNIEKLLTHIAPFLKYTVRKQWVTDCLDDEMDLLLPAASVRTQNAAKRAKPGAVALAAKELCKTFEQPAFLEGAVAHDWKFWIPPMRLFLARALRNSANST